MDGICCLTSWRADQCLALLASYSLVGLPSVAQLPQALVSPCGLLSRVVASHYHQRDIFLQ